MVNCSVDRRFSKYPSRLLERGGCEEALRVERRPGHAQQHRAGSRRLATLCKYARISPLVLEAVDQLARQKIRIAGNVHSDLSQHLPDDHFDVPVGNRDTLRPVDRLHL